MIPWVHGFSDPDELIGEDLDKWAKYLSIFGWETEEVKSAEGFKVWFHHEETWTSMLFAYAYDMTCEQDPVFPCLYYWTNAGKRYLCLPETIVRP